MNAYPTPGIKLRILEALRLAREAHARADLAEERVVVAEARATATEDRATATEDRATAAEARSPWRDLPLERR
jgi:hypothetical protein